MYQLSNKSEKQFFLVKKNFKNNEILRNKLNQDSDRRLEKTLHCREERNQRKLQIMERPPLSWCGRLI